MLISLFSKRREVYYRQIVCCLVRPVFCCDVHTRKERLLVSVLSAVNKVFPLRVTSVLAFHLGRKGVGACVAPLFSKWRKGGDTLHFVPSNTPGSLQAYTHRRVGTLRKVESQTLIRPFLQSSPPICGWIDAYITDKNLFPIKVFGIVPLP